MASTADTLPAASCTIIHLQGGGPGGMRNHVSDSDVVLNGSDPCMVLLCGAACGAERARPWPVLTTACRRWRAGCHWPMCLQCPP